MLLIKLINEKELVTLKERGRRRRYFQLPIAHVRIANKTQNHLTQDEAFQVNHHKKSQYK